MIGLGGDRKYYLKKWTLVILFQIWISSDIFSIVFYYIILYFYLKWHMFFILIDHLYSLSTYYLLTNLITGRLHLGFLINPLYFFVILWILHAQLHPSRRNLKLFGFAVIYILNVHPLSVRKLDPKFPNHNTMNNELMLKM